MQYTNQNTIIERVDDYSIVEEYSLSLMKHLFYFLALFAFSLCADVFDHLKKIEDKPLGHSMRNIDFIYMINLDHRPEKFQRMIHVFKPYNINPFRFSAVYGLELSLEVINDIGIKYQPWMDPILAWHFDTPNLIPIQEKMHEIGKTYFGVSRISALGIVLSHLSVLQDAYESGYETIWVLEDDEEIIKNPHILSDLIDQLDQQVGRDNWDVLYTDREARNSLGKPVIARGISERPDIDNKIANRYRPEYCFDKKISNEFRRIGARFGAYSMIIRRSGIIKILQYFKKHQVFLYFDIDNYGCIDLQRFTVLDDIVSNDLNAISDNGALWKAKH